MPMLIERHPPEFPPAEIIDTVLMQERLGLGLRRGKGQDRDPRRRLRVLIVHFPHIRGLELFKRRLRHPVIIYPFRRQLVFGASVPPVALNRAERATNELRSE